MRRVLLSLFALLICCQAGNAQLLVSNPYAGDPKSTLPRWPVLYKLPPSHKASYYAMGYCGLCGKGPHYQQWYNKHATFDVNALPEISWQGRIKTATARAVEAVDDQGKPALMLMYPNRKVSDVHVVGPAEPGMLKLGSSVRFVAKVDDAGRVVEPVAQLEFYTPQRDDELPLVVPGGNQLIAGRLVRHLPGGWELRPARRCQFNGIEFSLTEKPGLTVDVAEVAAVHVGQQVTVRGRLFDVAAQAAARVIQAGPGYFEDPTGAREAEQAELAAEAAEKARNGETQLVPMIFTCQMVIRTGTDDANATSPRTTATPSQLPAAD